MRARIAEFVVLFVVVCVMLHYVSMSLGGYVGFFFFKQKTAYEMRISDWSSDVCSSDLFPQPCGLSRGLHRRHRPPPVRRDAAPLAAYRRLLVSARRHPDRRLLAIGAAARRAVASRSGRRALSRPGMKIHLSATVC